MKTLNYSLSAAMDVVTAGRCHPLLDTHTANGASCVQLQTAPKSDNAFALSECTEVAGITEFLRAQADESHSMHEVTPSSGFAARQSPLGRAQTCCWLPWRVRLLDARFALFAGMLHGGHVILCRPIAELHLMV